MMRMDPQELLSLCKRRGFLWPAYDIYGGLAGLYDYGPLGAALKKNIEEHWRDLYLLGEGFFEISCPMVAPESVFKASGHADAFSDAYVECTECGETFRADHLAVGLHENSASLGEEQLGVLLKENKVKCPTCGGELTEPRRFNLMFKTSAGAGKGKVAYLRPETAQGMFVNFSQIYRFGREKLPVGAVQIGRAFRNEISPRQGLIRLREFSQMEAELFLHPDHKSWPRYKDVKGHEIDLVPNKGEPRRLTLEEAVTAGTIANEVLAYFIWLTYRFAIEIGLDPSKLRFRQHLEKEMAHYAADCWDLEANIGYGWTELVGIADRGSYDVQAHMSHSGADLTAFEQFDEPREIDQQVLRPNFKELGPLFKDRAKQVAEALAGLPVSSVLGKDKAVVDIDGERVRIPSSCYDVITKKEKVSGRKFVPHVIEPSYGVDRILYSVLDHAYVKKDDHVTLRLKGIVAPVKAGVFPLMARDGLDRIATDICDSLAKTGMTAYYDDSGSIGRRYARMDEIGTPCCVTVDYDTKVDGTVTVRERDTAAQVRIPKERAPEAIRLLLSGAELKTLASLR